MIKEIDIANKYKTDNNINVSVVNTIVKPPIKVDFDKVPTTLKNEKRWFNWTHGDYDPKRQKWGKIPTITKWEDPGNWKTFDDAKKVCEMTEGSYGLAFCLAGSDYIFVDIDGITKQDTILPIINKISSYTERSIYGKGLHIIFEGSRDEFLNNKFDFDGCDHIEVYNGNDTRWIAITGLFTNDFDVVQPSDYTWVHDFLNPVEGTNRTSFINTHTSDIVLPNNVNLYPPCIKMIIKKLSIGEGVPHDARVHLVIFSKIVGLSPDQTLELFKNADDYDENKTKHQIASIYQGKLRTPYSCDKIKRMKIDAGQFGICDRECGVKNPIVIYSRSIQNELKKSTKPVVKVTPEKLLIEKERVDAAYRDEQLKLDDEAIDILKNRNVLDFLKRCFELNHIGHSEIFRCVIYAWCAQSSITSKGIQPEATGAKGSGKTHGITSTLHLFPEEYVYNRSLSPKNLFYDPPKKGSMIYVDEKMSPDLINVVKKIMSNFQNGTTMGTVIKGKPATLTIPPRQVIMGSTVNGVGEDQFNDRTVQVGIENESVDDNAYYEFESKRRLEGRPEFQITHDVLVCRSMMRIIKEHEFIIKMPKITFTYTHDRRLINILYDLVEASAILNFMQRNPVERENGIIEITPSNQDLMAALDFNMFKITNEDTIGRLTRSQQALHNTIQSHIQSDFVCTELDITAWFNKSQNSVRKLLYGDDGTPNKITGGLVEKTRWYGCGVDDVRHINVIHCKKVSSGLGSIVGFAAFSDTGS
jgi:hypothetical protein